MKVCDRCLKRDPEAKLSLLLNKHNDAAEREWDFCKSCVKEVAAWIKEGNKVTEDPIKLVDYEKEEGRK